LKHRLKITQCSRNQSTALSAKLIYFVSCIRVVYDEREREVIETLLSHGTWMESVGIPFECTENGWSVSEFHLSARKMDGFYEISI